MSETVAVEAARIPDRDRLLAELRDVGVDARPVGEVSIEVECADRGPAAAELFVHTEHLIMSIGAPFVPIKHDGVIYVRPPIG